MVKKIIKSKEIEKATKIFTDREKPRQVFWNEYNKLKENIGNIDDIYIITYYGVGGIGKSTLIKKLITELEEQEQDPYYLKFDFETNNDMKTILSMMKTNMEQKYKFTFPLFDMALYAYSYKIGENTEKPEIKTFAEQSRVLSFIFDSLEDIPLVGLGAKILKLADSGIAILKNSNQKYKNELIEIENKTKGRALLLLAMKKHLL